MDRTRRNILAGSAAFLAVGFGVRAAAEEKIIKVVARKFVFIPSEIPLKVGEPVVIELTAPEVVMGFNLPEFKVRTDVIPGQPNRVKFTPDKAGTFPFVCDIFCGDGHEGMEGKVVVS